MTSAEPAPDVVERVLRSYFSAYPAVARSAGDHTYDGRLDLVGADAVERRLGELDAQAADLAAVTVAPLGPEQRADVGTALRMVDEEIFHLRVLRDPATDPQWALWHCCDVSGYVIRDYAPAPERAAALVAHLEQVPDWLEAAAADLERELAGGPRDVAVESLRGHASFYRDDARRELGDLHDAALSSRLDAAVERAAAAVDRHVERIAASPARADWALGPERFVAMLHAQEGAVETAASLRARVDGETAALQARGEEVAARLGSASLAEAFARMEADHPGRDQLLDTASGMLEELRSFWQQRDVLTVPEDSNCLVRPSPAYFSFVTASLWAPGFLDPPGLPSFYYVTPVSPEWSEAKAEEWLRHLNHAVLLNVSVHEVYPGHFLHSARSRGGSRVRGAVWYPGFGEGWAHYTEHLAVEHGLGERHPTLELAMVQDALLRCGRFSATVGMHAEGRSLAWATDMLESVAGIPRLAAEREALRGTYDPMYLSYTYGKLEILRWRAELEARPGFSQRRFHDRMVAAGCPPLGVMEEYILGAAQEWLG